MKQTYLVNRVTVATAGRADNSIFMPCVWHKTVSQREGKTCQKWNDDLLSSLYSISSPFLYSGTTSDPGMMFEMACGKPQNGDEILY